MAKKSTTYILLKKIGLNFSEDEYGQVSFGQLIKTALKHVRNAFLLKYCMYSVLLSPINYRKIRPVLWRWMGAKVGKDCFIGYEVWVDMTNTHLVELEDHVHIANRCLLLCHQRDLTDYCIGDDYAKLGYQKKKIILKKGCLIGMNSMIMPGVTVGEGAIVGAGSLVTKDVPAWTIATGRPAKVVKHIPQRP
ncbi:MAG: acyltransferase [Bacteroidales bacterium]|nr:acyltransferase [Bacteroidales bacterium]